MKTSLKQLLSVALALFACAHAFSPGASAQAWKARGGRPAPRFEDYPVREVYRGTVAPVRLDSRKARAYRTRLREDSRAGPNFAGRYTVVVWGCGTGCAQMGVVDAVTGRAYFPPVEYMDIPDTEDGAARSRWFRLDSKLLRITQNYYDGRGGYTAYYFLFDRGRFRLLRKAVERHPDEPQEPEP
ncbi:MAG: hypothetical protein LC795_01810 [Acidobacteria bacterium]|nr:hypothetical protein [Acidobacteriota bacterium]